jgi:hypothetical protein
MGLDQFNLSAFWQIIGLKRRSRAIWHPDQIVGCHCKRTGTRRGHTPVFGFVQRPASGQSSGNTLTGANGKRSMCSRSNRLSGPVPIFSEGKACASQQEKDHTFQGILRIRCTGRQIRRDDFTRRRALLAQICFGPDAFAVFAKDRARSSTSQGTTTKPGSSPATVIVPQPRCEPLKASLIRTQWPI